MGKPIAISVTTILILCIAVSVLPLSVGTRFSAVTDDNRDEGSVEDTKILQLAPLSPNSTNYVETTPDEFYGYIPPPVDLSHLSERPVDKSEVSALSLPSSFDWRDYGKVTPVKNQNPCGTCWIFGPTSVLESAVLIGESEAFDFSEQSVALCVDRSWTYLYKGVTDPCLAGGWGWLASEVFIKKGAVLESCNPYDTSGLRCDGSCVCDECPPIKNADGYRLVTNDGSQIDLIKNAIYNQGPVTMAFYYNSGGVYSVGPWGTIYDFYPCEVDANHMVSIVGWDDDVPHPDPDHTGTGAWIAKNSWGTGWGNNGFFYLAYDSSCVTEVAYLTYRDYDQHEELLYWDEAGFTDSVGYIDSSAWMASVFTAAQSGNLTHVDFWTTSSNARYEIRVWDGYFGSELARQTGGCQELGYYSIPLSAPVSLDADQQFTIGVKMITLGYGYPIPVESKYFGDVSPPIQSGVSFVRHTASDSWEDLAIYDWNACLRARIVGGVPDISVEPISFDVSLNQSDTWNDILEIGNDGNETLTYSITDNDSWLDENPKSGSVPPGEYDNITVTIDTTGLPVDEYYANITITNNDPDENPVMIPVHLSVSPPEDDEFDTGTGTYPSISGTHTGTITPIYDINVSRMYTYPCVGTGGHTESVHIWGNGVDENASWAGYSGDWHNITFSAPFTLKTGKTYNYEITTGSYPQIIHAASKPVTGGTIAWDSFVDVNGNEHSNWILAMRLE
ncbi:MAG: hypothetical protein JW878_05475 [Methanomicrobia archaeon]|nr:hypothetical protein [Methanomicrobia archaeon]